MIGDANIANPIADGMVSKNASLIPRARIARNSSTLPTAALFDTSGSVTVPIATPKIPRQLHQPKCNVQPTYRTVAKAGRKSAVDKHVHLHGAGGDHGGPHQREYSPDAFIAPLKIGVIFVTNAPKRRELSSQLPGSADQRPDCQPHE